jgi:hypothetical protein
VRVMGMSALGKEGKTENQKIRAKSRRIRSMLSRICMYRHILIPTDGSELAEHAVTNGLSLAKSVGAKVSVIVVEEPFN